MQKVASLHAWGHAHRLALTLGLMGLLLAGGLFLSRVPMQEDIEVMLPDSDPAFVSGYALLKAAPFTRSVVIDLEIADANQITRLTESAARLSAALPGPLITEVGGALSMEAGLAMLSWFYDHLPHYFDEDTAQRVAAALDSQAIAQTLQASLHTLMTPEGMWLRSWLGKDPLALRNHVLRRLGGVALLADARIEDGFLIDPSGRHTLLVAETPVPLSDARRGEQLLAAIDRAVAEHVSPEVKAHVVCAHRYTVANATAIKRDLVVVFVVSTLALLLVFLGFLRHARALYVFAVPVPALLAGVLVTWAVYGAISAITLGFGAVLLGISVDYGLHVYFVLRQRRDDPAGSLAHLAVPLTVSCVTTMGAFAVLLFSGLPIQRQLSVFAMTGLLTALLLALTWLPHWVVGKAEPVSSLRWPHPMRWQGIVVWAGLLVVSVPLSTRVSFDGDLRNVGLTPPAVLADEQMIAAVWGDPRGRALVVTQSQHEQAALAANEQVYAQLSDIWDTGELVSVAPVLLSQATQTENLRRWETFWQVDGRRERLQGDLAAQGQALGFAAGAFEPFLDRLSAAHVPFSVAELREATGPMLKPLFSESEQGLGLISLVPDGNEAMAVLGPSGLALPPETRAVSQRQFAATLRQKLGQDFRRFLYGAWIMVVVVLSVTLRRATTVLLCLTPAFSGLLAMLGIMGALGLSINMFNIAASVLVLGLSIDYGVFMVRRPARRDGAEERAVLVSALTTLSGFGALALARHPALFSLGITVVLGIVPAMLCALYIVPALQGAKR